jgi:hypothetical protein
MVNSRMASELAMTVTFNFVDIILIFAFLTLDRVIGLPRGTVS